MRLIAARHPFPSSTPLTSNRAGGAACPARTSQESPRALNWRVSRNCASSGGMPIRSYLAFPSNSKHVAGAATAGVELRVILVELFDLWIVQLLRVHHNAANCRAASEERQSRPLRFDCQAMG